MKNIKIVIALTLLIFTGCYTQKKATEQVNKANDKFPAVVAKLARDKYPCTDLLKPDTLTVTVDSLVYIDCPELVHNDYSGSERTDTIRVRDSIYRIVKIPVNLPVQVKYITKWFEDSSKLKIAAVDIDNLTKENTELKSTVKSQQTKIGKRNKVILIESSLLFLILLYVAYRVWKGMTTIKIKNS